MVLNPILSQSSEKWTSPADRTFSVKWKFSKEFQRFSAALDLPCRVACLKMKASKTGSINLYL